MSKGTILSAKELAEYWENFTGLESDDDEPNVSESDDDDPTFIPQEDPGDGYDSSSDSDEVQVQLNSDKEKSNEPNVASSSISQETSTKKTLDFKNKNIIWKKKSLELNEEQLHFRGNATIPANIMEFDTPFQFFNYFMSDELIHKIVNETNVYSVQKKPERPSTFTEADIRQYIGILVYMSLVNMPNTRSYWSQELNFTPISDVMSINSFEKIRQFIHFNNNEDFIPRDLPGHDKLHKIRPLLNHFNEKFSSVPLEQCLSIDEQMCSTKVRHHMKQYMPQKPHKWGFKLFVLAGVSGYAYKFEIYSGQENNVRIEGEPDFGATSNVVLRLARIIPRNENFRLYHDNYYTSLPLMVHLANNGIHSLGTVRRNRIPNCKFPSESEMKKTVRGSSEEYVTTLEKIDISSLIWKDNKCVTLLSSFAGKNPVTKCARYDRKEKKTIQVDCPHVIGEYNKHMGGVDLLDSLMGRYKIFLKSRKWYMRLFYHLIDLSLVNAWLLYKRIQKEKGVIEKNLKNQAEFRAEISNCLCNIKRVPKRGRPKTIESHIEEKRRKGKTQYVPPQDVRQDQIGHWPLHVDGKMRCKLPKCKGFTRIKCEKCGVALCLNKINNCFKTFHTN